MVRMNEGRQTKKVWRVQVIGMRRRGRPNLRWMDGVSRALEMRGMNVEQGREMAWTRNEWKRMVCGGREWYVVKDDAAQRDFPCTCPALGMDRCEEGGILS